MEPVRRGPAELAEAATLGGLLIDPRRLPEVEAVLTVDDFANLTHAAVFEVMTRARAEGKTPALPDEPTQEQLADAARIWVHHVIWPAAASHVDVRGAHGDYLTTLMRSCPFPEHTLIYARGVLEESVRRSVRAQAWKHFTLLTRDPTGADLRHALAKVEPAMRAAADTLGQRLGGTAHGVPLERVVKAHEDIARSQPQPTPPVIDEEDRLLGALLRDRGLLTRVASWLHAEDFTAPGRPEVYRAIQHLHTAGQPADWVTVALRARREGAFDTTPRTGRLAPDDLIRLARHTPPADPEALAVRVMERGARAQLRTELGVLQRLSANMRVEPAELVAETYAVARTARKVTTRVGEPAQARAAAARQAELPQLPPPVPAAGPRL